MNFLMQWNSSKFGLNYLNVESFVRLKECKDMYLFSISTVLFFFLYFWFEFWAMSWIQPTCFFQELRMIWWSDSRHFLIHTYKKTSEWFFYFFLPLFDFRAMGWNWPTCFSILRNSTNPEWLMILFGACPPHLWRLWINSLLMR